MSDLKQATPGQMATRAPYAYNGNPVRVTTLPPETTGKGWVGALKDLARAAESQRKYGLASKLHSLADDLRIT